jgi:hypothetical protein
MVYKEQSLGKFLAAKEAASTILMDQGVRNTPIGFEEGLIFQATSHLLLEAPAFYGFQVMALTEFPSGAVYPVLKRLATEYGIFESRLEAKIEVSSEPRGGMVHRPRRFYTPTPQGERILALFQRKQ